MNAKRGGSRGAKVRGVSFEKRRGQGSWGVGIVGADGKGGKANWLLLAGSGPDRRQKGYNMGAK